MRRELKFFAGVAIGIGIGIGIAFGAAFSQTRNKQKSTDSDLSEEDVVIDLNQMNRRKRKAKNDDEE